MSQTSLNVLAVVGSLNRVSATRVVVQHTVAHFRNLGATVDVLDLLDEPMALFNPDSARASEGFPQLQERVARADVYLLGTPDYHGSMSGAMKNFLDHFWQEFAGKLFASIVASHEKGLTVTDQLRTVARQCYAWSLPYAVSFADNVDVKGDQVVNEQFEKRLHMLACDARIYGELLARQRQADLAGAAPSFMARHRKRA